MTRTITVHRPYPDTGCSTGLYIPSNESSVGFKKVSFHQSASQNGQNVTLSRRERRDFRITALLFLVTVIFIVSWIPPYVSMIKAFYIGYTFPISIPDYIILMYGPGIFMINNFANPLLYVLLNPVFRRNIKEMFSTFGTCSCIKPRT